MDRTRRRSSKSLDIIKNGEDLIQYFYKCMLPCIVDQWEEDIKNPSDYLPTSNKTFIYANKSYVQACNEAELENDLAAPSTEVEEHLLKSGSRTRGSRFNKKSKKFEKTRSRKFSSLSKKSDSLEELPPSDLEDCVIIKFTNGNFYNGPVYKKRFHGKGKFRWNDGSTYVGEFLNGEITGKGKFYFNDQSSYEGEVYHGFPHGYGKKFTPESPSAYCGQWQIGKKHGPGWVIFSEDNWYEGDWHSDKMHGNGLRCYPDGSKYQGSFHKGRRHGNGCAILWNNDIYVGEWVNGKRSGYGEYIWKSYLNSAFVIPVQNKYIGHWTKNRMHGKGELHFGSKNGARYVGQFFKNYKHGGGVVICDNGDIIQCDKIFANDKPIHLQENGSVEPILHVAETCMDHCRRGYEKIEADPNSKDAVYLQSDNKLNKKIFVLPSSDYEKETAKYDLCQFKIVRNTSLKTFRLPINSTGENINLDSHIRKLYEMIYDIPIELEASDSFTNIPNSWEKAGVQTMTKAHLEYNYQEIYNIEEKALRRVIHINLRRLREIYKHYSLIGCLKNVTYDTLMNRLFLWQLYRDCKISEKGISITHIDVLLAEDSISFSESIHDPFENIYFWQFLTTLVKAAWEIYGNKTTKYVFEGRSILEGIFTKFLHEDIYPNAGHHLGSVLFDYKDILPIKAAYNWYKSIEEPMTIKTFVYNIFSLDKKETHHYEPIPKNFYVKTGANITIGNNVVFLAEEEPKYCVGPKKDKVLPFAKKCLKKRLYFLRELGRKFIYKKIKFVVPGIFINKECFNHEYKLCFLEFYEIVLTCTQHLIKKKEFRFKKKIAKISDINENVLLKIMTSKKSKQYRKSASHHSIAKRAT